MSYVKRVEQYVIYLKKDPDDLLYPSTDEEYSSYFEEDVSVKIKNWRCPNEGLLAVLVEASSVQSLVASHGIETVVWVKKEEILNDN